jgi:hypothetical protein
VTSSAWGESHRKCEYDRSPVKTGQSKSLMLRRVSGRRNAARQNHDWPRIRQLRGGDRKTRVYPRKQKGRPTAALSLRTARFYLIAVTFDFLPIPNVGAFARIVLAKSSSLKWP